MNQIIWLSLGVKERRVEITDLKTIYHSSDYKVFLDSSFLLGLMRQRESITLEFIEKLQEINEHIVTSYTVRDEFKRNLDTYKKEKVAQRINNNLREYNKLYEKLVGKLNLIRNDISSQNISTNQIKINKEYINFLNVKKHLVTEIEKINNTQVYNREKLNKVKNFAEDLFNSPNFISKPGVSEFLELISKGYARMIHKFPPGYEDYKEKYSRDYNKENNPQQIVRYLGDYFIWESLLKNVGDTKYIIFITDDKKEDWWDPNDLGKEIYTPRRELIEEFKERNPNSNLHMITLEKAILLFQQLEGVSLSDFILEESNYSDILRDKLIKEYADQLVDLIISEFYFDFKEFTWQFSSFQINDSSFLGANKLESQNYELSFLVTSSLFYQDEKLDEILKIEGIECEISITVPNLVVPEGKEISECWDMKIKDIDIQDCVPVVTNIDMIFGGRLKNDGMLSEARDDVDHQLELIELESDWIAESSGRGLHEQPYIIDYR